MHKIAITIGTQINYLNKQRSLQSGLSCKTAVHMLEYISIYKGSVFFFAMFSLKVINILNVGPVSYDTN